MVSVWETKLLLGNNNLIESSNIPFYKYTYLKGGFKLRKNSFQFLLLGLLVLGLMLGSYQGGWKQGAKKVTTSEISSEDESDACDLDDEIPF
jgi:hypothetical protein